MQADWLDDVDAIERAELARFTATQARVVKIASNTYADYYRVPTIAGAPSVRLSKRFPTPPSCGTHLSFDCACARAVANYLNAQRAAESAA